MKTCIDNSSFGNLIYKFTFPTQWVRVYSDGFKVMGGYTETGKSSEIITFLKPFSNTNYTILTAYANTTANTGGSATSSMPSAKTTSNCQISQYSSSQRYTEWVAYGY